MTLFEKNKFVLLRLGLIHNEKNQKFEWKHKVLGYTVFVLLANTFICSLLYTIRNFRTDVEKAIYATFATFTSSLDMFIYITFYSLGQNISELFADVQRLYDKDEGLRLLFNPYEKLCARLSTFIMFDFAYGVQVVTVAVSVLTLIHSYLAKGFLDIDDLFVPYRYVFPWNQHTMSGWICAIVTSVIFSQTCFFIFGMSFSFFIAITMYFNACRKSLEQLIDTLNETTNKQPILEGNTSSEAILIKATKFHIFIKDLFERVSSIFSIVICVSLLIVMAFLSIALFQLDVLLQNLNLNLLIMCPVFLYGGTGLFIYCFCGERTTNDFKRFSDCLYESFWYNLPMKPQKYIVLMIMNMKQPLIYKGVGMINLNMETFLKIAKTGVTYYITLKTFAKS